MKILHCMHNYFPARGGAEGLMQHVSEKLAAKGHDVTVLATNAHSTEDYFLPGKGKNLLPVGREDINGVEVERVPFSRRGAFLLNFVRAIASRIPIPCGNTIRMKAWGPRSQAYSRKILNADSPDLIAACPLPTLNIHYAWKAARQKNIPLVLVPCFHTEDKMTFHNPLYFKMLRDADAVITLTEWEKDYLHSEGRIPKEKLFSFGVGIEKSGSHAPENIRQKYGITEKEIVLFLGQQAIHKGIPTLIKAMKRVWEEKQDTALVIAGNPTAHTAKIEEEISKLGENKNKVYLIKGFPEAEKKALLQSADIFVSVSPFESFGIVFLEAWQEKLPVIGCRRGGSSKIIDEFKDGLLVHDENFMELAGAILELLDNPAQRREMGESGFNKTVRNYSWDKIIDLWESLYHDVVQRHRHSL